MIVKKKIVVAAEYEGSYWGYQRKRGKFGLGPLENAYLENYHFCKVPTDMPHPQSHHLAILAKCRLVRIEVATTYEVKDESTPGV